MTKPSLEKRRVVVIRGGRSSEREISIETGKNVEEALKKRGHFVIGMDVGPPLFEVLIKKEVDVAFVALHGKWGEDGTIQGLLEILGIPYTGSGVLASALAMDKIMTKRILESHAIPTPPWFEREGSNSHIREKLSAIGFPVVVKPAGSGSTVGISIVKKEENLEEAILRALQEDRRIFFEKYIPGRELTVGILGKDAPFPLPVVEIETKPGEFYDYEVKYTAGRARHLIPAPLEKEISEEAQSLALHSHQALACKGCSRVDMRFDGEKLYVLEVNTVPGMTRLSLLPEAAREARISFEDLVELLVGWALEP